MVPLLQGIGRGIGGVIGWSKVFDLAVFLSSDPYDPYAIYPPALEE
jgi:hypothetical protein